MASLGSVQFLEKKGAMMKFTIDGRSFLLGAALTLVCTLVLGAASPQTTQAGRYQINSNPGTVYLVDTVTGQVWERYVSKIQEDADFKKPKINP
jgi:hypothetical protein